MLGYLETATDHQAATWSNRGFPVDPAAEGAPLDTISLLELASLCFVDPSGVLRRHRVTVRKHHSVRISTDPDDRGVICVPRALRLVVLSLYHSEHQHTGRARLMAALEKEYWWPTMGTDALKFVDQCHVCNAMKASRTANDVPVGQYDQCLIPSLQVTMDVLGKLPTSPEGWCYLLVFVDRASRWIEAIPMKGNSTEDMLEALLKFIWRRGCPQS